MSTPRLRARAATLILGVSLLAACGGSAAAVQDTPTTAEPAPTTTVAPSTTIAPTTTTVAPTTTTPEDVKTKIIADFDATVAAYDVCLADPGHCDVSTIAAPDTPSEANLNSWFAELARAGVRGRTNPAVDSRAVVAVEVSADGASATVTTCMVDGRILFTPGPTASQSDDVVVNDQVVSSRTTWSLTKSDSAWKRRSARVLAEEPGDALCVGDS